MVVAKTSTAMKNIQNQFKKRLVKKTYKALLHGKLKEGEGKVTTPVGRLPWNRERFGVLPGGRMAVSRYRVIKEYSKEGNVYSLVYFFPLTGRTHQIRIQAKYLGNPVVADDKYAGRKVARNDRVWCPRLFLHAASIEFKHPGSGKVAKFDIDLSGDLSKALGFLGKS